MPASFGRGGRNRWCTDRMNPGAFREVVDDHNFGNAKVCERAAVAESTITPLHHRPVINIVEVNLEWASFAAIIAVADQLQAGLAAIGVRECDV